MSKIKVTCDSTCDLTKELYEKYDVRVMPLGITLGDEYYLDGVNVTSPDLYAYANRTGTLPKTSAVSPADYEDAFREYVDAGFEVVHISFSSEMSSCYQNACLAAEEVGNVYVVDSRNLSSGSGHLVIMARELEEKGLSAREIAEELTKAQKRLDVSFVVQTLEYLKMGGRCSTVAALGANILKIRPEIKVTDGRMSVARKYRGTMTKTIADYIRGAIEGREDIDLHRVFVTHSPMAQEEVDRTVALVKELQPFEEVLVTEAGCTIASHCGPDCIGVLFFTKEQ